MLRTRPDLAIVPFRGNVDTRLQKLRDGIADATLLAVAGLKRLGRDGDITAYLDPELFPPAPAQGAIGLEIRESDARTADAIAHLNHPTTMIAITAERAFLRELDGSCRTAIGVHSRIGDHTLALTGEILSPDGKLSFRETVSGPTAGAALLGRELGQILRHKAGSDFLKLFPA
jgi:hydroxymethylbilane synthase